MKKILTIIFIVLLLQLIVVSVSYAAPPASGGTYHTVRYGETLFSIGRLYGVYPYHIAEVNGLRNPDCIYAGQVLYIPSSGCGQHPCVDPDYGQRPPHYSPGYGESYCHQKQGFGYDYTGYYYGGCYPEYKRYSYTCGYYYNCY